MFALASLYRRILYRVHPTPQHNRALPVVNVQHQIQMTLPAWLSHARQWAVQSAVHWTARGEAFFVRYRRHLVWVHAGMAILFLLLFALPLLVPPAAEGAGALDHVAPLARTLVWSVWFPLVLISVVVTGRTWCGVLCPMGAASEWANRLGPQWPVPRLLRHPATPVVSFLLVTIWGQTVGVREHPEAMAIVFGSTFLLAVLVGFFFGARKRAWCRHACPIGLLLGVYARLGAVDFHPKRPEAGGDLWTDKTLCPTFIHLRRKRETRHCIECFRCVGPQAPGGLMVRLRPPGQEIATIRHHHPNLTEVLFLFASTGIALGGFLWLVLGSYKWLRYSLGDWIVDQNWLWLAEPGPLWLMAVYPERREVLRWVDVLAIVSYMGGWLLLVMAGLSLTTALAAILARRLSTTTPLQSFTACFVELGYQVAPVALVSLLLGLSAFPVPELRGLLFAGGLAWSLHLGWQLLAAQAVPTRHRFWAWLPGAAGSCGIAAAWAPALL